MKASDTVMNFMRIEEIDAKNATSNFTDALVDVAREQAEISFRAGMQEIANWIAEYVTNKSVNPTIFPRTAYQQKLKECGI